jgi:SAM-dependent methyltransferase
MTNFHFYAQYYDLLYKDKDYQSESKYICNLIKKGLKVDSLKHLSLLELGSGSGGHAAFIAPYVNTYIGIEKSEQFLKIASEKNILNFTPLPGDITSIENVFRQNNINQKFDAAVSLFHVISYLNSNEELMSCFKQVNKYLNHGGLFIFDVWFTPAVYWQKPENRTRQFEDEHIIVRRVAEPIIDVYKNVISVNFSITIKNKNNGEERTFDEVHPMRSFSIPEIELLARCSGFTLENAEEFLTGSSPSLNTWGVCFVLRKIE